MRRHTFVQLTVGTATGVICLAIDNYWFGPWHQPMRDWGLHWLTLVCASMFTMLLLQGTSAGLQQSYRKLVTIACLVPVCISSGHEIMQFLFPSGELDQFDCARDFALNVAGGAIAWWLLRRYEPPPEPTAPRRPSRTRAHRDEP
jgi:hypothetical protein